MLFSLFFARDSSKVVATFFALMLFSLSNAWGSEDELLDRMREAHEIYMKGDSQGAIEKYESLLKPIEKVFGKDSEMMGRMFFRLGVSHAALGNHEKAIDYLENSEKLLQNSSDIEIKFNLYWTMGMAHKTQLAFDKAVEAFKKSLKMKEAQVGHESPDLINILTTIATTLAENKQNSLQAIPFLERALPILKTKHGDESVEVAAILGAIGNYKVDAGQYTEALDVLKTSLSLAEKSLPPESLEIGLCLSNIGNCYHKLQDNENAEKFLKKGLSIIRKNYSPKNLESVIHLKRELNALALLYADLGNYEESIKLSKESIEITEKSFGSASPHLVEALNSLGIAYNQLGKYNEAKIYYDRMIRVIETTPAPVNRIDWLTGINNYAQFLLDIGKDAEAKNLFQKTLKLAEERGDNFQSKSIIAQSLNGLGNVCMSAGKTADAMAYFERSLDINKKIKGYFSQDVTESLLNIARVFDFIGEKEKSFDTLKDVLSIQEKILKPNDPRIAIALNDIAFVAWDIKKFDDARNFFLKCLDITNSTFLKNHVFKSNVLEGLAISNILIEKNIPLSSLNYFIEAMKLRTSFWSSQVFFNENFAKEKFIVDLRATQDLIQSICFLLKNQYTDAVSMIGQIHLILNKAVLEEIESIQAQLALSNRVKTKELLEKAREIKAKLSQFKDMDLGKWMKEINEGKISERSRLEKDLSEIQEKISEENQLLAQVFQERDIGLFDISGILPANSVLVDFVEWRPSKGIETNPQESQYTVYLTYHFNPNIKRQTIKRVDLGQADTINNLIEKISLRINNKQYEARDLKENLAKLSQLIYDPIREAVKDCSHLIICPDGQLSRIPFEMLPTENGYLVEEKTITYVTSGREIYRLKNKPKLASNMPPTENAVIIGNPDFDLDLASAPPIKRTEFIANANARFRSISRDYDFKIVFKPLPESEKEARNIAKILQC